MIRLGKIAIGAMLMWGSLGQLQADVITSTQNQATFNLLINGMTQFHNTTWGGLSGTQTSPQNFSGSGLSYNVTTNDPGGLFVITSPVNAISTFDSSVATSQNPASPFHLTINNFGGGPVAIGGHFYITNASENAVTDANRVSS